MEPIENEHQRAFRLGKAPDPHAPQQQMVEHDVPYQPPSVVELYKRMFPNGETFQHKSVHPRGVGRAKKGDEIGWRIHHTTSYFSQI